MARLVVIGGGAAGMSAASAARRVDPRLEVVVCEAGGFAAYGVIENSPVFNADDLLPMGLAEGCRLTRDISKDEPIRCADVEFPAGRFCDKLHSEQKDHFASPAAPRR